MTYPILGDAKLVLRQMIDACREVVGDSRRADQGTEREIEVERQAWIAAVASQADGQRGSHKSLPGHLGLHADHPS